MCAALAACAAVAAVTLGAAPAHAASETEIASKIRAEAEDFLTALLGQGRAKVIVSVDGEQTQSNTASERMTPVSSDQANPPSELPGYAPDVIVQQQKLDFYNKNQQNLVISGYTIKRILVSVVLDSSVGEKRLAAIQKLLGSLLHLNFGRGDELNIVRAQLLPPWKAALENESGIRMVAFFGGAAGLAVFMGLFAYWAGMRMIRAFAGEVTGRIMATITAAGPKGGSPIPAQLSGGLGGDLLPGEMPDLMGEEGGERPGLGRRFDFLSARKPDDLARILATETPEDIALLSAYLANTNPDLAGAIFAALPPATQTSVSHALAALQMADPERLAMLESRLKTAVEYSLQGSEKLGRILSHLSQEQRETVIGDLSAAQPERAAEVEKALFPFEDIIKLSPPDLRRLIMAVHYEEWGIALRGAPDEVVSAVLNQLLAGSRSVVREAMETPQTRQKVAEARSKIVVQAHAMAARGQIMLRAEEAA